MMKYCHLQQYRYLEYHANEISQMEKEKDNELTHMWAIKQKATNKPNS